MRASFPVPASEHADALAFIRAEQVALRETMLAAMRKLGPATAREIATAIGAVAIYKSGNMETAAWRHIFSACSWIAHPHRRVEYLIDGQRVINPKTGKPSGAQFASAPLGFNVPEPHIATRSCWTTLKVSR